MRTSIPHIVSSGLVLGLAACGAEAEPDLLVPDSISVAWSDAYDGSDDGLGAVVPVDVMVYDSSSGAPLAGVELSIASEHDGTWVIPEGRVVAADSAPNPALADVESTDPDAAAAWLRAAEADEVQVLFDTRHDRFVTIEAEGSELRAGATTVVTNASGVARVLLFVDRFPAAPPELAGAGPFADVAVVFSAASPDVPLEGVVLLQPR